MGQLVYLLDLSLTLRGKDWATGLPGRLAPHVVQQGPDRRAAGLLGRRVTHAVRSGPNRLQPSNLLAVFLMSFGQNRTAA